MSDCMMSWLVCVKRFLPHVYVSGKLGHVGRRMYVRPPPEFLLQDTDLPRPDPDHLQVVSKGHFIEKFGKCPPLQKVYSPPVEKTLRRISVVLPLHLSNGKDVIPIPFIIDTGAPDCMYLGTGAVTRLRDENLIAELSGGLHPFFLKGKLSRGELFINNPSVSELPLQYEELSIRGDLRLNLLGLLGIELLIDNVM